MTFYNFLKLFVRIKSNRLRLLGLAALHLCRRRYLGIYIDPAMGCNLRCRMCYYSGDQEKQREHHRMTPRQIDSVARALFHRALKLQIGCGAEPTLYTQLPEVVGLAKAKGVPYVSITTNGQLLSRQRLEALAEAGLDEVTLSMHGFSRQVYEHFMPHAKFDVLLSLLADLKAVRERWPQMKLRINFTINEDNMLDLPRFAQLLNGVKVDILQVRPIQDLQHSDYTNFSLEAIKQHYADIFPPVKDYCSSHGITFIYPELENLDLLHDEEPDPLLREIQELSYCYVHPRGCWKDDFDPQTDTFESYCRRTHRMRHILSLIFGRHRRTLPPETTKALNYKVK